MRWPRVPSFVDFLQIPPGVVAQQAGRGDLAAWTAALSEWHPDLAIGEEAALLSPATYEEQVALRDEPASDARDQYTLILRAQGAAAGPDGDAAAGDIVGGILVEYDPEGATMAGRMSVVSPTWRGRGLGRVLLRGQEALGRGLGARSVWGLVELDNLSQQHLLESQGFWRCGIVPESDQRRDEEGRTHYVPEALYIKPLVPPGDLLWPQRDQLTDDVAGLFALLPWPGSPFCVASRPPHTAHSSVPAASAVPPPPPRLSAALRAQLAGGPAGVWPDLDALLRHPDCDVGLLPGDTLRVQRAEDIGALAGPDGLLARWQPAVGDAAAAVFTAETHHWAQVALARDDADPPVSFAERPYCHLLLCRGARIVGFCALSVDAPGVNLFADLVVVDPQMQDQDQGQTLRLLRATLWIAAVLGVETVLRWVTLMQVGAQRTATRAGLSLWGIVPASEVSIDPDGRRRYACEALFGASLIPPSQAHWPDGECIAPGLRALAQQIRGAGEPGTGRGRDG